MSLLTRFPNSLFADFALSIDLLPALEMGVRFLPEQHVGIVRCHSKYAHGSLGRTSSSDGFIVPANSSVEYSITVHEILKSSADNFLEIDMLRSRWKKQIASDFYFRYAEYNKALQLYKSASDILQSIINSPINEEENTLEDAKRLLVDVCNNAALCQIKLNEYLKAKEYCLDALQRDPKNIKALCRTAKCCIVLGKYDEAESCLDKAKHYQQMTTSGDGTENGSTRDSGSSSIQHMTHLLRQAKRSYKLKEKVMYRKMYKGIGGGELAHTSHFDKTENITVGSTSDTPNDDDDTFRATASDTSNIINFAMRNGTWISLIFPLLVAFVAAVWFQCFANKRQEYSKPI
jgi:tetratricopeptide (TPR) repeat protein